MTRSEIRQCVDSLRDELFAMARDLVRCPSVTGDETGAQNLVEARWSDWGLRVDRFIPVLEEISAHPAFCDDGHTVERPVLVARWGEPDPSGRDALILNGHIDVVPPGERALWSADPFAGRINDGMLFGRGSCDMKGGLAAMSFAVRAAQKLGVTPRRPVLLQSVTGEETGGLGTLAAIQRGYRADAAVIIEPTGLAICPVHSGALSFRLRVPGRPTHGAMREEGVSAIEKFWPVWRGLTRLETERHRSFRHPMYSTDRLAAPLSVGRLRGGNWPSTVPEEVVAEGRFGVFPGEDPADARRQFEVAIEAAGKDDPWLKKNPVGVEWFEGQFEPGETSLESPILAMVDASHRRLTGHKPVTHGVPYGCDLRLFTRYGDTPAVLYGPGDVRLAHAADERIPLDELVTATCVLTDLVCGVAGDKGEPHG